MSKKCSNAELIVADDENGVGLVVQVILSLEQMEALAKARELYGATESWSDHDLNIG